MSELTQCNHCTLEGIKARYFGKIEVRVVDEPLEGFPFGQTCARRRRRALLVR